MNVRLVPCFECFGTGLIRNDNGFVCDDGPCPVCKGEGEFPMTERPEKQTIEQQMNYDKENNS